jgi:pimeloyl-ACP methyl ester carboxylesterase
MVRHHRGASGRRQGDGGPGLIEVARRTVAAAEPLELLYCPETEGASRPPVVFVHGAYVGAWCWAEHFLGWFAGQGYPAYALSLRGHGRSAGRDRLHQFGLDDYAADLGFALAGIAGPPLLVGHSMGAIVVQKYLEGGAAAAAAFLCPVPPTGLLPASWSLAMTRPALFAEINAMAVGGRPSPAALREALFAGPLAPEELARHYERMQGESRRALLDMSWWGLPQRWRMNLPASLVLAAEHDVLIPRAQAELAARHLEAEFRVLPGLGHAVMLESGWLGAAQALGDWLAARGC